MGKKLQKVYPRNKMSKIYYPAEDSFLLSKILKKTIKNKKLKILEMGSGSGIQAKTLASLGIKPENITLVDINSTAIKHLRKEFSKSKIVKSDLFQDIKLKFDLIIFNPPYLPEDKTEPEDSKLATTGGKKGSEIINKFLKQSKKHLIRNGKIILLTSNLTKGIDWLDYKKKLLGKKKLFFEELSVWEVSL